MGIILIQPIMAAFSQVGQHWLQKQLSQGPTSS
jgi:hypothetical protein